MRYSVLKTCVIYRRSKDRATTTCYVISSTSRQAAASIFTTEVAMEMKTTLSRSRNAINDAWHRSTRRQLLAKVSAKRHCHVTEVLVKFRESSIAPEYGEQGVWAMSLLIMKNNGCLWMMSLLKSYCVIYSVLERIHCLPCMQDAFPTGSRTIGLRCMQIT